MGGEGGEFTEEIMLDTGSEGEDGEAEDRD